MKPHVVFAIFKRNFVSYFSSPTGYVFLCVFVLLSGFAAFWPNDFFNANLANLDQLNKYLPYIMLVFIPAITMAVWADERRLGTDELLLTIPASDLDVVLGKYLATISIFTVSLVYSGFCNYSVLWWLGGPDLGLFLGMYFGYWMVGLAMLAIGMVASFLTSNLTVGFVLGAAFNAPLVFASAVGAVFPSGVAVKISNWSIANQFRDFGRGVVSLSSVAYFSFIVVVMLYLCMVLIGRRHWSGGRGGPSLAGHYLLRALSLVVIAVSTTILLSYFGGRLDVTVENLNSLSPDSKKLVSELKPEFPIKIDAFVSPESEVPESYVQTRLNLLSALNEIQKAGAANLLVEIHEVRPYSDEASLAEDQFEITPREVTIRSRGALKMDKLYLGLAFRSGLHKVVVPFVDRGIPIEYELIRSIATVARGSKAERKTLGILRTDAGVFNTGQMLKTELDKQYDVEEVDPSQPITETYDVLLAVQPSSLGLQEMDNFLDAVRGGQATAIFEDPMPVFHGGVPGTSQPKQAPGGMFGFGMGGRPQPKGDINQLWDLLGVKFEGSDIVWQNYNPHPQWSHFPKQFVFISKGCGAEEPFNERESITSGLQELLFACPGFLRRGNENGLTYTPLVFTGRETGTVPFQVASDLLRGRQPGQQQIEALYKSGEKELALAAHIQGRLKPDKSMSDGGSPLAMHDTGEEHAHGEDGEAESPEIDVVLVADIDVLSSTFFDVRAAGDDPNMEVFFNFDNVTFVLNTLDVLADDMRFVDIRKRRPQHRTLTTVENKIEEMTKLTNDAIGRVIKKRERDESKLEKEFADKIAKLEKKYKEGKIDQAEAQRRVSIAAEDNRRRRQTLFAQLQREANRKIADHQRRQAREIEGLQDVYKFCAVVPPPIFPLLVGIGVFFNRRARERQGVVASRLRRGAE